MKFPRNTRLLRSPFDVAPFAAVFFLLVIFVMLGALLPTPGIPLQLPMSESSPGKDLPGTDKPSVAVAVDSSNRLYFANQIVNEAQLNASLRNTVKNSRAPLTLVIYADKSVTYGQFMHLTLLARDAGISNAQARHAAARHQRARPAMNDAAANTPLSETAGPTQASPGREPQGEGWSKKKWLAIVAIIFAAHVAVIFAFGARKQIVLRPVTNVLRLKLADNSGEMLALDDPTLFAQPHLEGFAGPALRNQQLGQFRQQDWTEPPRWLPLSAENLGTAFSQFMQTNFFASRPLDFKPSPKLTTPPPVKPVLVQNSTLQIVGGLARRRLLDKINLPSLQYNDVIAPSIVQALVDATGNVVSAVLLPSENSMEAGGRAAIGDTNALQIARTLRFAPSSQPTFGKLIFNWRTIPLAATNAPAASP